MAKEQKTPNPDQNNEQSDQPDKDQLLQVLTALESQLARQTSLKFVFVRGAIYGLGTVIGATLLIALFGGIIATIITTLDDAPIIGEFVDEEVVDDRLNELEATDDDTVAPQNDTNNN